MGLETLSLLAGGLNALKTIYDVANPPKPPTAGPTLSFDKAKEQAGTQLNPLYDKRMKDVTENVQKDLTSRGFAGQQAGNELTTSVAADNERERIAAIGGLANSMMTNSANDSYRKAALDYDYDLNNRRLVGDAWNTSMNWMQNQDLLPSLKNLSKPKAMDVNINPKVSYLS